MSGLFKNKSINALVRSIAQKKISPVEIAKECILAFNKSEERVKAWVCFDSEKLLSSAKESEAHLAKGGCVRTLEGMPVGVKDIMNTVDFPTQMGSPIWKDFTPGNDARVVFSIKQTGAILPGKTVTAEFAVHTLGKTLNPHNPIYTPGTSSSGSAAAVAMGIVPAALGTQTAGSIVRPSSFCGVYGFKPSFGLIPRTGMLKTTDSLDTVGFIAYHFEDLKTIFEVLRVHGPNYPISDKVLSNPKIQRRKGAKWKVAFVKTHTWENVPDYAKKCIETFLKKLSKERNVILVEKDLPPRMQDGHKVHATIYDRTLAYYFCEEYKKAELVSPIMNRIIAHGNTISVADYQSALKEQECMCHDMNDFFKDVDVLISHATAGEAPLRENEEKQDPSLLWTMTHLPVIHSPVFKSPAGLPFGLQVASAKYLDYKLLSFCEHLVGCGLLPKKSMMVN